MYCCSVFSKSLFNINVITHIWLLVAAWYFFNFLLLAALMKQLGVKWFDQDEKPLFHTVKQLHLQLYVCLQH